MTVRPGSGAATPADGRTTGATCATCATGAAAPVDPADPGSPTTPTVPPAPSADPTPSVTASFPPSDEASKTNVGFGSLQAPESPPSAKVVASAWTTSLALDDSVARVGTGGH